MNQTIQPHWAQTLAKMPLDQLRQICQCRLVAGSIWRPSVVALRQAEQWYWRDVRETGGALCGPFPSERDALCNAISEFGAEDAPTADTACASTERPKAGLEEIDTEALLDELRRRGALVIS